MGLWNISARDFTEQRADLLVVRGFCIACYWKDGDGSIILWFPWLRNVSWLKRERYIDCIKIPLLNAPSMTPCTR
jgi:hypothetical protein